MLFTYPCMPMRELQHPNTIISLLQANGNNTMFTFHQIYKENRKIKNNKGTSKQLKKLSLHLIHQQPGKYRVNVNFIKFHSTRGTPKIRLII